MDEHAQNQECFIDSPICSPSPNENTNRLWEKSLNKKKKTSPLGKRILGVSYWIK